MLIVPSHKDVTTDTAMLANQGQRLLVDTGNLRRTRVVDAPDAIRPLQTDGVRLHIEHFALTANNVTYAAFGDAMKYWSFFPSGEDGWGCIPVWGFAQVVESMHPSIPVGERVFGYLPMASHLVVQAGRVDGHRFVDVSPHRNALPPVYNDLLRCACDPLYHAESEGAQAVLRPLFITSFLIDDFLAENEGFGARSALLSSASSKTAYATAFSLAQRRGTASELQLIGLTSQRNLAFTKSLGLYDRVVSYEDLELCDPGDPALYIDFSGDAPLRRRVHQHWKDQLKYSCSVGGTHWEQLGPGAGLPGPRPQMFFAPAQVKRRMAPPPEGWGAEGFQLRVAQSWSAFARRATEGALPMLRLQHESGAAALTARYLEVLDGQADPGTGFLLSL